MGRYAVRSALGLACVLAFGLLLTVFLAVAAARWDVVGVVNTGVSNELQEAGNASPQTLAGLSFVTEVGAQAGWLILPVTVVWLLIRRLPQLAIYAAVAALGAAVLNSAGIFLLGLIRPIEGVQPTSTGATNLFIGGSIGVTITAGVLLLLFLPVTSPRARRWVIAGTAFLVVAAGVVRVAVGTGELWPVAAGWLLGSLWLVASAAAFRRWREQDGLDRRPLHDGLPVGDRSTLIPAPLHDKPLPGGGTSVAKVLGAAVLIAAVLTGAGLLITEVLGAVQRFDSTVVEWFASIRTDTLTFLATMFGSLGTTVGIVSVLLIAAPLALALTKRWAPTAFLLMAAIGETSLFLTAAFIVGRPRPSVDHLTASVPPTPSFPSGHTAATVVTYGGIALLLMLWTRSRLRYIAVVLAPLIVIGVGLSRIYWGLHYPSDIIASILFASAWLAVCWWVFRPGRGSPGQHGRDGDRHQSTRRRQPSHAASATTTANDDVAPALVRRSPDAR